METIFLEGKGIARQLKENARRKLATLATPPRLVSILASDAGGARYYANKQKQTFEKLGVNFAIIDLSEKASEEEILTTIDNCNADAATTGILLLMPLPPGVDSYRLRRAIAPQKDIEGITPANMGRLFYGDFTVAPCTAKAVCLLLADASIPLAGKEVVVVSHSEIVGKPLLAMLLNSLDASPTPTCCHIATIDLCQHTRRADILIAAAGKAGLIKGDMIKPGAILIDVGINVVQDPATQKSKVIGDIELQSVTGIARMLTPVPGGVGTVTTAVLLDNLIQLLKLQDQCRL